MALTVNDISVYSQNNAYVTKEMEGGKTTITPFEDVLKQQEKVEKAASSATKNENELSRKVSNENVASTKGTVGTKNADGSLTTTLDDIFKRASEKYGVSYDFLLAVAKAESNFNIDSVSSAGAQGMMQLMPTTAKELGVKDAFDVEQSVMGAAKLLAAHLKRFGGDTTLAAAAYNAGGGAVEKYGGVPPYSETQNYVKKIAKYLQEGVTVPDRTVTVNPNKLSGDVTKSQSSVAQGNKTASTTEKVNNLNAVQATVEELNQSMVTVGSGEGAITMTYGAYQRYLELGNLGVG